MPSPYHPLQLALGLIVWAVWFSAIYGALSVACVLAPPPPAQGPFTWINATLLLCTLPVIALLLLWARQCWRAVEEGKGRDTPPRRLIVRVAAGVHLAGAIATLSVGLTLLVLPPCV